MMEGKDMEMIKNPAKAIMTYSWNHCSAWMFDTFMPLIGPAFFLDWHFIGCWWMDMVCMEGHLRFMTIPDYVFYQM